jgi:hypothetical protein
VEPVAKTPIVLTHGSWRRRRLLALLLRWAALLAAAGVVALGVWAAFTWYSGSVLALNADQLYEKVLAEGNLDTAWRQADPRFQALYPLPVFREYARRRPGLFDRDKLTAEDVVWLTRPGEVVIVVKARVGGGEGPEEVSYYCTRSARGGFRLLGIGPDLTAAVPTGLEPYPGSDGKRGGRRR